MNMTGFHALSSRGTDRESWLRTWEVCGREPFAHPAYVELFTAEEETPCCVVARTTDSVALVPVILRPIQSRNRPSKDPLQDATSPYGYGGPYRQGIVDWDDVYAGLAQWMAENRIVSMFGRLALETPTPDRLPPGATIASSSVNVVVDLTRSSIEQWRHYEHKVRKNVNKATRANLQVEVKDSFKDIEEFSDLYRSTMDRRNADSRYYFGAGFFAALVESLADSYVAAEVRDEAGRLVSAELVLCSDKYLYSFLGGTLREAFPHAPNDLLKHAVIEYGHQTGRSGFVLGGGYTENDGILRYKKSFDPTGIVPFRRLEMISDQPTYDSLVAERLARDSSPAPRTRLTEGFFPSYRSQVLADEQYSSGS